MSKKEKASDVHVKRWGHELWIENCPEYCGKLLCIKAGKSTSMHFHVKKLETMYLQSGWVHIEFLENIDGKAVIRKEVLYPGDKIVIPRLAMHRIVGVEDSTIYEFSTQHFEDDSYRIEESR